MTRLMSLAAIGMLTCTIEIFPTACGSTPDSPSQTSSSNAPAPTEIDGKVADRTGRPLSGVTVTIVDGPLAGTSKTTNDDGAFQLTATTSGSVTVHLTKDGFDGKDWATVWVPRSRAYAQNVYLDTVDPSIAFNPGNYVLTVSMDLSTATDADPQAPCAGFPADLAQRTYDVSVTRTPNSDLNSFDVHAEGPTVVNPPSGVTFQLGIAGRFIALEGPTDGYELTETLPGSRVLAIGGSTFKTNRGAVTDGSTIVIPFDAVYDYCQVKPGQFSNTDCSWFSPDQIVERHYCASGSAVMMFALRAPDANRRRR